MSVLFVLQPNGRDLQPLYGYGLTKSSARKLNCKVGKCSILAGRGQPNSQLYSMVLGLRSHCPARATRAGPQVTFHGELVVQQICVRSEHNEKEPSV